MIFTCNVIMSYINKKKKKIVVIFPEGIISGE